MCWKVDIFLPRALAGLKQSNADVRVFIHMLPKSLVVDRVCQRYADLGLVYGSVTDPRIDVEELASTVFACALPKNHPLCTKRYIAAQHLRDQPLIMHGKYTTIGSLIDVTCKQKGVELPPVSIETSSCFTACLMVNAGAGIALVDSSIIKMTKEFANIVLKPFRPVIKLKTQIIFPRNVPRSIAIQAFVHQLKKIASPHLKDKEVPAARSVRDPLPASQNG